jgi:predicted PurR-regulated permease PerM
MSLHPAVAFAAALIGGALGGLFMAFLALPVAGVIQAAVKEWSRSYEVVADVEMGTPEPKKKKKERQGFMDWLRSSAGNRDINGD